MVAKLPNLGDLVAGRYRILKEIGRGGFGIVYHARQEFMQRSVALKFLSPEACKDQVEVERFRREVFHASGLTHPNTITFYDYGQTPQGLFYIVMEYLEGHDLRNWLGIHGALSYDEVYSVLHQLLGSLKEAHQLGIVHRDLKLENIFLKRLDNGELQVKVLDFGLSKYVGEDPSRAHLGGQPLTVDGLICGTPQYMSPERAHGDLATAASDIYAVGIIAQELLTGKEIFTGSTALEILLKQINDGMPPLPESLANTDLAEFIEICTRKKPSERFADADEASEWLHRPTRTRVSAEKAPPALSTTEPAKAVEPQVLTAQTNLTMKELEMRLAQLPLVGRDRELSSMLQWTEQALKQGGVLGITSEAGMGKSRLVEEWLNHVVEKESICLLRGRFRPEAVTMDGLREAFAGLMQLPTQGLREPARTMMLNVDAVQDLRYILHGDGSDAADRAPGGRSQNWALARLRECLVEAALHQPTLLVLEDLQYGDSFSNLLVEHLQQEIDQRSLPLAIVITSRHQEMDEEPRLQRLSWKIEHIALRPLNDEATHSLAHRLLPAGALVEDQLQRVSQGNPLFLIEMARYLVEMQRVVYDEASESWTSVQSATGLPDELPPDIQSLVLHRLENLLEHHRRGPLMQSFLVRAALLGSSFKAALLRDLLVRENRPDLLSFEEEVIKDLSSLGILRRVVQHGEATYEFAHYLMRPALLARARQELRSWRQLHELAAVLKIEQAELEEPEHADGIAGAIAYHYLQSRDLPQSLHWWMRAAEYSERVHDFQGALAQLREVEKLLDEELDSSGEHLLNVRLRQGRLYRYLGEYGPAEGALRSALEETKRVGDLVGEALTGEALANVLNLMTRFDEALPLYEKVAHLYTGFQDISGGLRCELGRGNIARFRGRYRDAEQLFEHVRAASKTRKEPALEAQAMIGLGRCAYASGRLSQARQLFDEAARMAQANDLPLLDCAAHIEIGCVAMITTGIEEAEAVTRYALDRARHLGDRLAEAHAHLILALCLRRTTRLDLAQKHARSARLLNEKLGHSYGIAKCILLDAELAWVQSRLEDALQYVLDSRKLHEEIGDAHGMALCMMFQGLFECETGRSHEAHDTLQGAIELNGREGLGLYQSHCLLFVGMVYETEGNIEEAIAYYGESLEIAESCGNREMASFASINLAKLHLILGDIETARQELPQAWEQARKLGHCYAMMFALTGQAWLARILQDPETLRSSLQQLRVYQDAPHGPQMRITERLFHSGMLVIRHPGRHRMEASLRALGELLRSLGDDALAESLRAAHALPA